MAVISLELNELNFDYVKFFVGQGKLPTFARLLDKLQLFETVAEKEYPYLEPWIQWPSVYTGKTYAEHGIFRLGDAIYKPQDQIWEEVERLGGTVGAVSPMNAVNRCVDPDFFLPDPWTNTKITADPRTEKLFGLIRALVNDNASSDQSTFNLGKQILPLALPYLQGQSLTRYFRVLPTALKHKWAKAGFLDCLLADLFLSLVKRHGTQFASLFLNAGAHIQHHHMYDSNVYQGDRANPTWYSSAAGNDADPLLFIYSLYDTVVAQFLDRADTHLLITTGLSQIPNERDHYQYRIVEFDQFFSTVGLTGARIEPRMSRDFLLAFDTADAAQAGTALLDRIRCGDAPLFKIEDRGETLFCQVAYFGPPAGLEEISIDGKEQNLREKFVLVSIENGIHQTIGYHLDSRIGKTADMATRIPLTEVHERLLAAAKAGIEPRIAKAA